MGNSMNSYSKLFAVKDLSGLPTDIAIEHIGILTDRSFELRKKKGIQQAIALSEKIWKRKLTDFQTAVLNYHIANAWGNLHKLSITSPADLWKWEQAEVENQLIYLRRAVIAIRRDDIEKRYKNQACPIYTNLAGTLSQIGRFVEAIAYWDKALYFIPDFSMARGNRGAGLVHYAQALYDDAHSLIFFQHAYDDLESALRNRVELHARPVFERYFNELKKALSTVEIKSRIDLSAFSLGESDEEVAYKKWCLKCRLFLSPLNDLGNHPAAASDILSMPSIVMKKGETPYYHGYYNQLKQEFVSARWLYYEGVNCLQKHFSDRNVLLFDTLDNPVYSLAAEKEKLSFRMAYSLFDKIAFFLNRYLDIHIEDKKVNFRTLWYRSPVKEKKLREKLADSQNWPLRGLFWLSKDLYEDKDGFKDALEPDARQIHSIRNHLEHKYLKLHDASRQGSSSGGEETDDFDDSLEFSLSREDFEARTLRILKMARAALIYLSLTVHAEESRRSMIREEQDIPVMELPIIGSEMKNGSTQSRR
jgi:tetratricopeptide (TPR) repeat protein